MSIKDKYIFTYNLKASLNDCKKINQPNWYKEFYIFYVNFIKIKKKPRQTICK